MTGWLKDDKEGKKLRQSMGLKFDSTETALLDFSSEKQDYVMEQMLQADPILAQAVKDESTMAINNWSANKVSDMQRFESMLKNGFYPSGFSSNVLDVPS